MRKTIRLETKSLDRILDAIRDVVSALESARTVEVNAHARRDRENNSSKAALARSTLHAAELAGLLTSELHTRYWAIKGVEDVRWSMDTDPSEGMVA